jgi:hypothetical protein
LAREARDTAFRGMTTCFIIFGIYYILKEKKEVLFILMEKKWRVFIRRET